MRPIKFRAWDKYRKQMYHVIAITNYGETYPDLNKVQVCNKKREMLSKPIPFHDIELLQFTGLKDKNGKEIYEGDIVRRCWRENLVACGDITPNEGIGKVIFQNGCFRWQKVLDLKVKPKGDKRKCRGVICSLYNMDYIGTVIGNIYESSELLEANHE